MQPCIVRFRRDPPWLTSDLSTLASTVQMSRGTPSAAPAGTTGSIVTSSSFRVYGD